MMFQVHGPSSSTSTSIVILQTPIFQVGSYSKNTSSDLFQHPPRHHQLSKFQQFLLTSSMYSLHPCIWSSEEFQGKHIQSPPGASMDIACGHAAQLCGHLAFFVITLKHQKRHLTLRKGYVSVAVAMQVGQQKRLSPMRASMLYIRFSEWTIIWLHTLISCISQVGEARTRDATRLVLEEQLRLSALGIEARVSELQTATGVKDKTAQHWIDLLISEARSMLADNPGSTRSDNAEKLLTWLDEQPGDKVNPLLFLDGECCITDWESSHNSECTHCEIGLDPNRDTPVEILHTILLGIVKYIWYYLHSTWSEAQLDLFTLRLQSTNVDGLSIPPIRASYMVQYRGNLIGKHFKTLMQTLAFHVYDLTTPEQFGAVKAIGLLGSALWVHEIDDMQEYTVNHFYLSS